MSTAEQTCNNCFFTTKFPDTKLNDNGICNHCLDKVVAKLIEKQTQCSLADLKEKLRGLTKNAAGKYDCAIGASGGLDSSYVIYIAKTQLGLNPLVISYNSGFTYSHAIDNLTRLCKSLDVDLVFVTSKGRYDYKYVRSIIRGLSGLDSYWGICSFCHYILPDVVYYYMKKENISLLLTSTNSYEDKLHVTGKFRLKYMLRSYIKSGLFRTPMMLFHLIMAYYYLLRLKIEHYVPPMKNLFSAHPKANVQSINITRYVAWNIPLILRELSEKTGWRVPEHPNIQMRFDCMIEDSFINHTYIASTGSTVHGIIANNLISGGVQTKSQLEHAVNHYTSVINQRRKDVLDYLRIPH